MVASSAARLQVENLAIIPDDGLSADVIVIGSGAGGSILARALVKAGRQVLLLERGEYLDPATFDEDELGMFARLYADGAFQLTRDFRLQVLQGSCVGGTTVVNNAVVFPLPQSALRRWNDPERAQAGLDPERLARAFQRVDETIRVESQAHKQLNRGAAYFVKGAQALGFGYQNGPATVEANIHDCLGCGYCNIGCAYGRKLSMLDSVLPQTQAEFGSQALRIVAGCEVERVLVRDRKAWAVECRLDDGRKVRIRGAVIALAAGAISSSLLLMRSRLGGAQVGKKLSFNITSPITAQFAEPVRAYEGLQISHYLDLLDSQGFILETWFSPPAAMSLIMPGWFEDHYQNMLAYDHMASAGVLMGTEANASVRPGGLTGREISFTASTSDIRRAVKGLILAGEIYLASGAERVMPSTFTYRVYRDRQALQEMKNHVRDASDLMLGSSHPQGGNSLSSDPARGVVDPTFRVHGIPNLFVCDASVFPESVGVNPQLTVMALADYASEFVAEAGA